ncbi:MAG: DNA repair protein RecO [Bacteroidetes bacterium]|nr:MAG: DNA repair protein RecO [Bacteroidota bacterium]MBL1143718.1 DNA repair protein RecO [Bacteroidota bacterium]MCB0801990.1 DNA repair protein RecO [Flavobacteriales bacterium]NOG56520.1 DNA repair protein RecO [Bacteroidota bacterium]
MLLTTEGIVLNTTKYGDSSYISKIFTLEKGIISTITNRSKSSKKHLYLQAFVCVDLTCYVKQSKNIHRIKEIGFSKLFNYDSNNVVKTSVSFFIAEFLSKIIKEEEQNTVLYHYLKSVLYSLTSSEKVDSWFLVNFLTLLTKHLGIVPELNKPFICFDLLNAEFISKFPNHKTYISGEEAIAFYKAFSSEGELSSSERKGLIKNLLHYYSIQLDNTIHLKSLPIIEVIFT